MAFPTVRTSSTSTETAAVTTHGVDLPATIESGDLLLVFFTTDITPGTVTWPGGWTTLTSFGNASNSSYCEVAYKTADGTEDSSSISVTTTNAKRSAHNTYCIQAWHGTSAPEQGTGANQTPADTTPDPPSLTPSWGAADTLWFVFIAGSDGTNTSMSAWPTNYSSNQLTSQAGAGSGGTSTFTASYANNASSEDPGTATLGTTQFWAANTIAIRPAAASGNLPLLQAIGEA